MRENIDNWGGVRVDFYCCCYWYNLICIEFKFEIFNYCFLYYKFFNIYIVFRFEFGEGCVFVKEVCKRFNSKLLGGFLFEKD